MNWTKDNTGRFPRRPHYKPEEMDADCEQMIVTFLRSRYGTVTFPVQTNDLTILLEQNVQQLDLYADLSDEEGEVEGVRDFFPKGKPAVRISKILSQQTNRENRLRTTLTHELGHVKFHMFLFELERPAPLFPHAKDDTSNSCKREKIIGAASTDWMEWQAGYACGAFLMPITELNRQLLYFEEQTGLRTSDLAVNMEEGQRVIESIAKAFAVSQDAARVRLLQKGVIAQDSRYLTRSLF